MVSYVGLVFPHSILEIQVGVDVALMGQFFLGQPRVYSEVFDGLTQVGALSF
jgi:hypothetical protein